MMAACQSFGQSDSCGVKHNLIISVSPLPLLELYHGASANVGVEMRANDRYNFYVEYGQYLPFAMLSNNYYQKGHTFSGELKRYFDSGIPYISAQYMFGQQEYTRADPFDSEDLLGGYVVYDVKKKFQDFSVRFGGLFVFRNNFSFNPYAGIGLRVQKASLGLSSDLSREIHYGDSWAIANKWIHKEGTKSYLKVHFGFRLGLRIF